MKKIRKLFAAVLTLVVALAVSNVALAAGTGTITITPPANTQSDVQNEYKIYKVFDADGNGTNISYKLIGSKTTAPDGFTVDAAGNVTYTGEGKDGQLTDNDIKALTAYVAGMQPTAVATSTGTAEAKAEGLPNGYYFITTSTGTVVTIDSTNPNANVIDKNTVPSVKKQHVAGGAATLLDDAGQKALAQVGTDVDFSATVTFGKGSKNVVFHDAMGTGLQLVAGSVSVSGLSNGQYSVVYGNEDEAANADDDFIVRFADGLTATDEAVITYKATVTDAALTVDTGKNTATVSYGDKNGQTPASETFTRNASVAVLKNNGKNTEATDDDEPLAGAGFKLKNAAGKYYKLTTTDASGNAINPVVTWVDAEADGDEHTSGSDGKVAAFTGLKDGTYTLVETTVPSGYNKAVDAEVTIALSDADTNLVQTKTIANHTGAVLPSTGGIGTTIFYIVGGILLVGGAVMYITRKRVAKIEDES